MRIKPDRLRIGGGQSRIIGEEKRFMECLSKVRSPQARANFAVDSRSAKRETFSTSSIEYMINEFSLKFCAP